MSGKKDVSSNPNSYKDMDGFTPARDGQSRPEVPPMSSKALDNFATMYLSQIQEGEIKEAVKEGSSRPVTRDGKESAKSGAYPFLRGGDKEGRDAAGHPRNLDITMDLNDDLVTDFPIDEELRATSTAADYLRKLKEKISGFGADSTIDVQEIILTNSLLRQFALDATKHPGLAAGFKKMDKKVKKIRERAFKWTLDGRKVGELQQLFEVTDLIKQQKQFMFIDSGVLSEVFRPQLFHLFARHPLFPGEASTQGYKEVADFHNQLLSSFIKIYIQCPMSRHPHLDWTSLTSTDPFLRTEFRSRNLKFYQKHVERPYDFRLFDYSLLLLKQFNLAEFPTFANAFRPHAFVKIFQLISLGLEYGLYSTDEATCIIRELAVIVDIISEQQLALKKTISARRKSMTLATETLGNSAIEGVAAELLPAFADDSVRKNYLKQLGKIRLYCAKIIVQIISLNCDEEFVAKASLSPNSDAPRPVSLFEKPNLLRCLSVVVFNFLVNKFSSGIPSIDFRLDDLLTAILEFFTNQNTDFCLRSMRQTPSAVAESFCSDRTLKDTDAVEVNLKLKALLRFIRRTSRAEEAGNIEGLITDFCEFLEGKYRLKTIGESREQFSIALARLNVPNQLFNLINFFTGTEPRHRGAFVTILGALRLTMGGNLVAHASFFADKNAETLRTLFQVRPVETMVVFVQTFWDDMEVFWNSAVAREALFDCYKTLGAVRETTQPAPREVTVALKLFNAFLRRFFRESRKTDRWSRAMSLKYGDYLAEAAYKICLEDGGFFSRLAQTDVPFEAKERPVVDLLDIDALVGSSQSAQDIELAFQFSVVKLFNEVTSTVYTEKIHGRVMEKIWGVAEGVIPVDRPGAFLVKKEMLRLFRNFLISTNNRRFNAPKEVVINEGFIARDFFQPWIRELAGILEKEVRWLGETQKTGMLRRGSQAEVERCLEEYALKGLVPTVIEFIEMVQSSASHMSNEEELLELSGILSSIRTAMEGHADLLGELRQKNRPRKIESIAENMDRLAHWDEKEGTHRSMARDSERSRLRSNLRKEVSMAGVSKAEGTFVNPVFVEDQKRAQFNQLEVSANALRSFLTQYVVESRVLGKTQLEAAVGASVNEANKPATKKLADYIRRTQTQISMFLAFDGVNVRKAAMERVTIAHQKIGLRKLEFFQKKEGNVVRELFTESAKANKLNDDIAKYFLDWLFHTHANFEAQDPSDTYYLHSSHKVTLQAFICLLEWSRKLRYAITKQMKKAGSLSKEFREGPATRPFVGEVLRVVFAVYLQAVNFCFFSSQNDATRAAFEEDYELMADLMLGLCYQNPEFKAFYNERGHGVVKKLEFLAIEGPQPIFGELFFVVYILFYFNGAWKNRSALTLPADRVHQFPLLSNLLSMCTEMITSSTREAFGYHCQIAHDIWKGIIYRDIHPQETEFCDLKYRVMFFVNSLLQFLDNEVVVILDEVYDTEKLFRQMLNSVSDLFSAVTGRQAEAVTWADDRDSQFIRKANVFKGGQQKSWEKGGITSHRQLLSLYKASADFSEHVVISFVQEIYTFLKRMASKAKFYNIFLQSRERQAKSIAESAKTGTLSFLYETNNRQDHAILYFLMQITGSVEVITEAAQRDGVASRMLKREYFRLLPQTFFYTASMDREFYATAPMTGSNSKMEHLCNHSAVISLELQQNQNLVSKIGPAASLLNGDFFTYYNYFLILLTIILNIIMLVYMENDIGIAGNITYGTQGLVAVKTIAWILVGFALLCLVLWLCFRARLEYDMHVCRFTLFTKRSPSVKERLSICFWGLFLSNFRSSSYFFHVLFTILGLYVDEVFYTLNFIMMMNISGDVWYILHSIIDQFDKILATLFLLLLVLYSYAYLLLIGFADSFKAGSGVCDTFYGCFLNTILLGFIPGGGISDEVQFVPMLNTGTDFWKTFFLFVTFFLVVKLILINIINSIIVLTFNALRADYCQRLYQEDNVCYVCSDTKWQIQKDGINFEDHTSAKHSVRNYLFYQMFLKSLDFSKTTELMDFVINCCEQGDYSWMPHKIHLMNRQDFRAIEATGEGKVEALDQTKTAEAPATPETPAAPEDSKEDEDDQCSTYDDDAEESGDDERDDIQF